MSRRQVRITHRPSGTVIAEGPLGWTITPFEGNYYVRRKCLRGGTFRPNWVPGLCPYKFLYVWLDFFPPAGAPTRGPIRGPSRSLAWLYWLPNPLLPFIWFRVALPGTHPELEVSVWESAGAVPAGDG